MKQKHRTKLVHEGKYVAEVDVVLLCEADEGWLPYLSLEVLVNSIRYVMPSARAISKWLWSYPVSSR